MKDNQKEIKGVLCPYYETGLEGTLWCLKEDGVDGWDGLHPIEKGNILTVFNDHARSDIIWTDAVELELDRERQAAYLKACKYSPSLGPWGYGLPTNIHPFDWVEMFSKEKPSQLKIAAP